MDNENSRKRLVKNTVLLYCRTIFTMLISLYTSRATLQALGVENYGIQNVVGGFATMFAMISDALSFSIIRYITFEVGRGGDVNRLNKVFCTAVNIQFGISIIVVIAMELFGVWFVNSYLNIDPERLDAARWVFHCSVALFVIVLMCEPYNASIIAHEKMGAFAYVGLLQSVLNLVIVFLLYVSPFDKLITISVLGVVVMLIIRLIYTIYCRIKFPECCYHLSYDKDLSKSMFSFAGWHALTYVANLLSTQGVNILVNIFFGVTLNAARGVAGKIEVVVMKFVGDFSTALHPQITKSYAAGDYSQMRQLICRGVKYTYFLAFCLALPFLFEADRVLHLWLGVVPDYSVLFFRLSMLCTLISILGQTCATACTANGKIRMFSVLLTTATIINFPFCWLLFKLGFDAYITYLIGIFVACISLVVKVYMAHRLVNLSIRDFFIEAILRTTLVSAASFILPFVVRSSMEDGLPRTIIVMAVCVVSSLCFVYILGLSVGERQYVTGKVSDVLKKFHFKR